MSNQEEIKVVYQVGDLEVKLTPKIVQDFLVNGNSQITVPEFKLFTELCKSRKLNPFLKEAYIIKFGTQPAQIVVGKDAILKRAILNPKFNGREQGIIVTSNGQVVERKGAFRLKDEVVVGGWAKVYRKDWDYPVYISVGFDDVAQKKGDGTLNQQWFNHGETMVEKVALVRALREAFVEDLGGMIDEDEAWKIDNTPRKSVVDVVIQEEPKEEKQISLDDIV